MPQVFFLNRFFHPDNSATSLILTDLISELSNTDNTKKYSVICGSAKHINLEDSTHKDLNNVSICKLYQIPNLKRNISIAILNMLIFHIQTILVLLYKVRSDDTVVGLSDPPMLSFSISIVRLIKNFTFISWQQDIFPETASSGDLIASPFLITCLKRIRNFSLTLADRVIVPSQSMAKYLSTELDCAQKVSVIENFAVRNVYKLCTDRKIGNKPIIVGYSGNLGFAHEVDMLAELIYNLRTTVNVHFVISGGGLGKEQLKDYCSKKELPNVSFQKYVEFDRLNEHLNTFDIHLVSLRDRFNGLVYPSKIYNGFQLGIPTIFVGTHGSEIDRLLREKKIGITYSSFADLPKVTRFISEISNDKVFQQEISDNIQLVNMSHGNFKSIASEWLQIISNQ